MLDAAIPADQPPPRTRNILSAISLYLMMLSIIVTPIGLAVHGELNGETFLAVHKFLAIVVTAWAIASWRDVLPALKRLGEPKFYFIALLGGLGTFAVASVGGDLISLLLDAPGHGVAEPMLKWGFSSGAIFLLVAVFRPCLKNSPSVA